MDKLKMHSKDKTQENFEILQRLFPNAVTETIIGYDEDGKAIVERAIDKDVLQQEINAAVVEGKDERYQFTWPDKKRAIVSANAPINKTLRPCRKESVDFDNTENLYIEGDNLEVLKLLQETYLGKIKMIYIDPPYNTGHDFVYNDKFSVSADEWDEMSGELDEYGNRLTQNNESNGRFHTDWLNMIYPRLKIARDLLTDDGVIFISCDDSELHNLKSICLDLMGSGNYIASFIIASNSAKNNSKYVSVTHEYLLCFAKNKSCTPINWLVSKNNSADFLKVCRALMKSGKSFEEIHSELLALVKYPKYYEFDHYTYVDERGPFRASDLTAPGSKAYYDVIHPITKLPCKIGTRGWAYSEKEMYQLIENGYVLFGQDETIMPQLKNYLFDNEKSLPKSVLFFDSQSSTKWMKSQKFGFDFPKAVDYIQYIISMLPDTDITVLDFFSGSATTAHAVMQINAEDGGNRKYIMVQLPEKTDEKSEAYKAGYKNICEIGKERIRRAGKQIINNSQFTMHNEGKKENGATGADNCELCTDNCTLDIGFRVLKLDSSNMKDVYYNPADFSKNLLDTTIDNIKEDRTPEDLLFQVMLDLGVLLSSKIEETEIAGKKVFNVADGFLIACFDNDVNEEVITAVAMQQPLYFVMRDSSLSTDTTATNFDQIFETYSPDTVRKVI